MSNIHRGTERQELALFCQACGSASVSVQGSLVSSTTDPAQCSACGWQGTRSELMAVPFTHEFDKEELVVTMMNELRSRLGQSYGAIFGPWLLRWGFLSSPINPKHAKRYAVAIGQAIMLAVLSTRRAIAEEDVRGPTTH